MGALENTPERSFGLRTYVIGKWTTQQLKIQTSFTITLCPNHKKVLYFISTITSLFSWLSLQRLSMMSK